jgi:hypothetical protein
MLQASGISSSEPPATPDAPQAHSDATTLSSSAVGRSESQAYAPPPASAR